MTADTELIQQTVQHYFDGLYHSDVEKLKIAFHPNSQVIGHFQGTLSLIPWNSFLALSKAHLRRRKVARPTT